MVCGLYQRLFCVALCVLCLCSVTVQAEDLWGERYTVHYHPDSKALYLIPQHYTSLQPYAGMLVPLQSPFGPMLRLTPLGEGDYQIDELTQRHDQLPLATGLSVLGGDFDGDGVRDLLLLPSDTQANANGGWAVVVYGQVQGQPYRAEGYQQINGLTLAGAAVTLQDSNGDNQTELLIQRDGLQSLALA